jgi:hypothetical protein
VTEKRNRFEETWKEEEEQWKAYLVIFISAVEQ